MKAGEKRPHHGGKQETSPVSKKPRSELMKVCLRRVSAVKRSCEYKAEFILEADRKLRIGSDADVSDIWIASKHNPQIVSTTHAIMQQDGNLWTIIDLHSENGTYINGEKMEPGKFYPVNLDDVLAFGSAKLDAEFLYRMEEAAISTVTSEHAESQCKEPKKTVERMDSAAIAVDMVEKYLASERLAQEMTTEGNKAVLGSSKRPEVGKALWLWKIDLARAHNDPLAWEPFRETESDIIEREFREKKRTVFPLNDVYSIDLHLYQQFRTDSPDHRRAIARDYDDSNDEMYQGEEHESKSICEDPVSMSKPETKKKNSDSVIVTFEDHQFSASSQVRNPSQAPSSVSQEKRAPSSSSSSASPKKEKRGISRGPSSSALLAMEMAHKFLKNETEIEKVEILEVKGNKYEGSNGIGEGEHSGNACSVKHGKQEKNATVNSEEVAAKLAEELVELGANSKPFDCPCCMCKCEPYGGLYLSCSHPMCFECLRGFGAQKIEMRQLVTCPTCQEPVPHTDISRVFDRKEVKKYIGIEALSIRNNDDEKLFNCQTPDCPNSVIVDFPKPKEPEPPVEMVTSMRFGELRRIKGVSARLARAIRQNGAIGGFQSWNHLKKITMARDTAVDAIRQNLKHKMPKPPEPSDIRYRWLCQVCKEVWCVRCKIKWHDHETCLDIKLKDKFKKGENHLMKLVEKGNLFRCKCGKFIEKAEGCKYMECKCGLHFCWACKQFLERAHQEHECTIQGLYLEPERNAEAEDYEDDYEDEEINMAEGFIGDRHDLYLNLIDMRDVMARLRQQHGFGPPHGFGHF
mmetsp:Transcript_28988/g.40384  ORF Transcript_28988/g.40384 Transcript_28988/m.40384 type:complete len:803 (+) Transcript_28988:83-2491(+)